MKIWVVLKDYYYEGSELEEVFSSRASAEAYIASEVLENDTPIQKTYPASYDCGSFGYSIYEKEIKH